MLLSLPHAGAHHGAANLSFSTASVATRGVDVDGKQTRRAANSVAFNLNMCRLKRQACMSVSGVPYISSSLVR